MIDMRIGEYHITNEPRNYIVAFAKLFDDGTPKTITTKTGKTFNERILGYYNSMPLALQAVAKDMIKRGDERVTSVEQYVHETRKIDAKLRMMVAEYGAEIESKLEAGA